MKYDLTDLSAPTVSGRLLAFVTFIAEWIPGIAYLIGKDTGIYSLNRLALHEPPTFYPTDIQTYLQMKDIEGEDLEESLAILSQFAVRREFQSSQDFYRAYKSLKVSPVQIAHSIIHLLSNQEGEYRLYLIKCDTADLLAQAKASEQRYRSGSELGPLDGVPIAVKDEIDAVPYTTSVGTGSVNVLPLKDANIVHRLRQAGALIIGKANMHELGLDVTNCNPFWGTPKNPHNTAHFTGGSSGGSAACVASGLCPIALGADGGGSIRIPSSYCGIYGLKPTSGRISPMGAYQLDPTTGVVGPMASSAHDLALAYRLTAGPLNEDVNSLLQPAVTIKSFGDVSDLSDIKLGVYWPYFNHTTPEIIQACKEVLASLKDLGAQIVEIEIPHLGELRKAHTTTITSEMVTCTKDLNRLGLSYPTRIAFAAFNHITARDYLTAAQFKTKGMNIFRDLFDSVDAIVTPTAGLTAPKIPRGSDAFGLSDYTNSGKAMKYIFLANLLGIPAVTCPAGTGSNNLPIGVQFQAKWFNEDLLLRLANACEHISSQKIKRASLHHSFDLLG